MDRGTVPEHVEFYSKNKFEKLVHLVGFLIRIFHDARSSEHQISNLKVWHPRCVRSIIQSCSVYISIYTYSHETQQLYIISSDI